MAPSGAVVTILFLLMCLAYGQEIDEFPSDTTVFLDHTAVFTCVSRGADYTFWRVNGTAYNDHPPELRDDLDTDQETIGGNEVYTLTIPGRAEYNGTEVQCVAGDVGGGSIESVNVTLKVQGLLTSVGNLKAENSSSSITISWSAPFSLDVSDVDPDIWYTVLISNVTDEAHPTAVPCADCHNLTQTHYTVNPDLPSPCHKYTFTVIPLNGAGPGDSSQPVTGYTIEKFPPAVTFEADYSIEKVDNNYNIMFNISGDVNSVCRFILHVINMTRSFNQAQSDARRVVYSIPQEDIPENIYKIRFEMVNAAGSFNTTTYDLKTFDVQTATAAKADTGINMTGELIRNSLAKGCFVVIQCIAANPDHYRALLRNENGNKVSYTINVPSMSYTVTVYDLEENGLPNTMPAVAVDDRIKVPRHDKEDNMNSTFIKRAEISKNGSDVTITCEFADRYQEASCVLIYHEYDRPNLTVKVFNNSFYEFPVTITVDDPDKYTFSLFGKNGASAIEQKPVISIKRDNHASYPPSDDDNDSESDSVSASVIAGVVTGVLVTLLGVVVTAGSVAICKKNVLKNSNLEHPNSCDSQSSYSPSFCTNPAIGLVTGETKFVFQNIRADGENTQSQVAVEVEESTGERISTTMEAGEGEESKYASILTSTSGIRPPTVEKPVQYGQIDLDATKRKAHPQGLLYADVAPAPEGHGPKPNKMMDDPNTPYATILPHATSPTGSPNTESKQKVPKEEAMPKEPLTVEAVMTLLWCVARRWKEIADGFGIDEDLVDEIFTNNERDEACLQDCVEQWMKLGPTWKKLANVLRGMGEERLAGQAASKEPPELQRQICNEKLPAESTDEGFVQEGTSESGSSDNSAFVPPTNNSGQIPAVQQNSDNRGSKKTVKDQGTDEQRQVGPVSHAALQEHDHIYVNKNTACISEDKEEEEEENANVVLPESETSYSIGCSSDEDDDDAAAVMHIVGVKPTYHLARLALLNHSSCFKEPPIPSSRGCEDVLANAMETLSDYSDSKMEAGCTKISVSNPTVNIVCQPNAVFRTDQQDRGNDSDRKIYSDGLTTVSPQSCTEIPTEGAPLTRAKYSGTAVFSTYMESQPFHKNISLYRSYDEEKHNDELHAYSLKFMQCSTQTVESHAGMVIGRSLTMPCHMESSKTVEEPPNESHEEYLPPQQPPADKPCDNEEPEAPVKNHQWSDPPDNYREKMPKWTYTGVALGFQGSDHRISIGGRNSHYG